MLTDLEIVNNALGRLGCERIASLSDSNKRAKLANDFLNTSRRETLELSHWGFATKYESLTAIGTPPFKWTHTFCAPSDLISIVGEYNEEEYELVDGAIYANTEKLDLIYIFEIDENVKRTPNFDKAWYLVLASNMAYSLTQNNSLKESLMAEARDIASTAMSLSSKNSTPTEYSFDAFTTPRL